MKQMTILTNITKQGLLSIKSRVLIRVLTRAVVTRFRPYWQKQSEIKLIYRKVQILTVYLTQNRIRLHL